MCDALAAVLCKPIPPSQITLCHGGDFGDDGVSIDDVIKASKHYHSYNQCEN